MVRGKVKWFNSQKGWGFLSPENGDSDVFVHYSRIDMEGYRNLKDNDEVLFEIEEGEKGPIAINVRKVT
ncbi:MAG TPA: cold shock domain-containing protein [Caldisericia bacterium]|nr:cold shock domain-containing protein [Caldisericia bacterium]